LLLLEQAVPEISFNYSLEVKEKAVGNGDDANRKGQRKPSAEK
jgi:hypothetical protein